MAPVTWRQGLVRKGERRRELVKVSGGLRDGTYQMSRQGGLFHL
jgi:hypothetical protein